eukprot:1390315-Amorphochlora_amoeboformis.AAC.3
MPTRDSELEAYVTKLDIAMMNCTVKYKTEPGSNQYVKILTTATVMRRYLKRKTKRRISRTQTRSITRTHEASSLDNAFGHHLLVVLLAHFAKPVVVVFGRVQFCLLEDLSAAALAPAARDNEIIVRLHNVSKNCGFLRNAGLLGKKPPVPPGAEPSSETNHNHDRVSLKTTIISKALVDRWQRLRYPDVAGPNFPNVCGLDVGGGIHALHSKTASGTDELLDTSTEHSDGGCDSESKPVRMKTAPRCAAAVTKRQRTYSASSPAEFSA